MKCKNALQSQTYRSGRYEEIEALIVECLRLDGQRRADELRTQKGGTRMKRVFITMAVAILAFGVIAGNALAVTVPAVPVSTYGDSLLSGLVTALTAILPYAAAITAFAIGVGMLKRWLGHRKATRV